MVMRRGLIMRGKDNNVYRNEYASKHFVVIVKLIMKLVART